MKKKIVILTMVSLMILSGCGDTTNTYNNQGTMSVDNSKDDHSKNTEGHVAVSSEFEVDTDIDKSTNNTINNVSESFVKESDEYIKLQTENNHLKEENNNLQNQIDDLNSKQNNIPVIEYKNLGLSIDGEDIPINRSDSMVTIDGREYVSKEIADKLISDNQNITITDGTILIGKVIADKEKLSQQYVMNNLRCQIEDNATDSYGDLHNDCIVLSSGLYGSSEIQFNVNNNFNMLMGTLFVHEGASKGDATVVTIKADDEVIYTTNLESDTLPIAIDLPINNCSTITISKDGDDYFACVLSNAILYN